ncbi:MAG: PEP-CTERM sorting domain-containing protein [Planctomycetes bacterium]|nr:PEP-CTERM sorting domain-containing protein [Planctomycetota bacterium]
MFWGGIVVINCDITYNYVVPEPGSLLLLVGGGIALMMMRRESAHKGSLGLIRRY